MLTESEPVFDLKRTISTGLPLLMTGNLYPFFIFVISMCVAPLYECIRAYLEKRKKVAETISQYKTISIHQYDCTSDELECGTRNARNATYARMEYYITENLAKINAEHLDNYLTLTKNIKYTEALLSISDQTEINLDGIRIQKISNNVGNKTKSKYVLSATNVVALREFISMIDNYFVDNLVYNKKIYHRYNFDPSTINRWSGTSIYTVKTEDNVFLSEKNEKLIFDNVRKFTRSESEYKRYGIPYKLGYIFYGVPGCGKSSTIYALAHDFKRNIYEVSFNDQSQTGIDLFKSQILEIPPGNIVVCEDFDTDIVSRRTGLESESIKTDVDSAKSLIDNDFISSQKLAFKTILEILDGYNYLHDTIVILTTNHIDMIDPAIIRPGRIDHKIEFYHCDQYQLNKIFDYFYPGHGFNLEKCLSDNFTTSDIINKYILSHLDDPQWVYDKLCEVGGAPRGIVVGGAPRAQPLRGIVY